MMATTQVDSFTNVEKIFQFELLFAKICGGFQFEWRNLPTAHRLWLARSYRVAIVLFTRYWTPLHFMTTPDLFDGTLGPVPMQNFKLFYYACQALGYMMVLVNIRTGFKSHELTLVLLKKRAQRKYFTGLPKDSKLNHLSIEQARRRRRGRRSDDGQNIANVSCQKEAAAAVVVRETTKDRLRFFRFNWPLSRSYEQKNNIIIDSSKHKQQQQQQQQQESGFLSLNYLRISVTRSLFAINLFVAIYSVYVHRRFLQDSSYITTASSSGQTAAAAPFIITTSSGGLTLNNTALETQNATALLVRNLTANNSSRQQSLDVMPASSSRSATGQGIRHESGASSIAGLDLVLFDLDGFLSGWSNLLIAFVYASLNFAQMYGQIFVTLMITSSIADMLHYSVAFDEFASSRVGVGGCGNGANGDGEGGHTYKQPTEPIKTDRSSSSRESRAAILADDDRAEFQVFTTISSSSASGSSSSGIGSGGHNSNTSATRAANMTPTMMVPVPRTQYPFTTRVLLQAREALLVIRYTVDIEYLLVLLFDLARFGAIFCLLDESIFNSESKQKTLPLIMSNFALVFMSILMTRIGHRWIHYEVEKMIHNLEKSAILADLNEPVKKLDATSSSGKTVSRNYTTSRRLANKQTTHLEQSQLNSNGHHNHQETETYSASTHCPSIGLWKSNRTTAIRLAQEVVTIWPTDWYTPDYKSCIEQVIYVLTFVATIHQLAEASFRVDNTTPTSNTSQS